MGPSVVLIAQPLPPSVSPRSQPRGCSLYAAHYSETGTHSNRAKCMRRISKPFNWRLGGQRSLITVCGRHSSYLGMMSRGATLHRGKTRRRRCVKIETCKQSDENKGKFCMALDGYFYLPRLFSFGEAIEPMKDEGSQGGTCWPNAWFIPFL